VTVLGAAVLAAVAVAFLALFFSHLLSQRPTSESVRLFAEDHGIGDSATALELSWRYFDRARRYRFLCSFAGFLVGIVAARWWAITWLPGWFVGVIGAELFRLRPNRRGPQTASLRLRSAERYAPPRLVWHSRILAACCAAMAVAVVFVPWRAPIHATVASAVAACAVLLLTEVCQHAIAARTRPALPPELEDADDAIRRVGAKAVGYAGAGIVALLAAVCVGATVPAAFSPYVGWHEWGDLGRDLLVLWAIALAVEEHRVFWPNAKRMRRYGTTIRQSMGRTPAP
jgi:multisubunit Na+/H+ antiporter MnhB subunit